MPVSEDEFEKPVQMGANQSAMSKAEQRKSNKPIMEKRRRARINHCLNELKTLILDAMKKDPARHSKLEKADILEMTVKHLQQIQRQQLATAVATDPSVLMRFKSGFDECAAEVNRYVGRLEGVDNAVKQRLAAHLHRCVSGIQQISAFPHQNLFSGLAQNCDKTTLVLPSVPAVPGDVNNNSNQAERIQIPSGLHLIPSRLPTGELALLVPNSSHMTTFLNAPPGATFQFPHNASVTMSSVMSPTLGGNLNSGTNHASAFTAVGKNQDYPSPTSTADLVKKESNAPEKDRGGLYSAGAASDQNVYVKNYNLNNYKVTESRNDGEKANEDQNFNKLDARAGHDPAEMAALGKFKGFGIKSEGDEQRVTQRASSSSFQRTVADSTTSFLQPKEPEVPEFKPFQVEIPNSHLKAHISISENFEEVKANSPLPIQQKPNPNFVLNPNRLYQKSPHKFSRNPHSSEGSFSDFGGKSEIGFEKFLKIEPLSPAVKCETPDESSTLSKTESSNPLMKPCSSETFQNIEGMMAYQRGVKRPPSNESPEASFPSSSESPTKTPRISLNVTLTDGQSKDEQSAGNRCKRISVIVEDSSKGNGRENKSEVTVNVSSQKDMWRPW